MNPEATVEDTAQTIDDDAPEASTEEILDAVNEELEFIAPEDDPNEPANDPEPEIKAEEADEPEVEAKVDDGEPVAEPDAEGKDDTGTEAGEAEPVEAKDDAVDAKPSDEFGTLEKDTPEKTRERFEAVKTKYDDLITERDELVKERDEVRAESDRWVSTIRGTGTNQDQFGMVIDYLGKVNSGDPKDLEAAYEIMSNELTVLGQALGKPVPGVYDPLTDNVDLKQRVEEGVLDEKDAHELAEARAFKKINSAQAKIQGDKNQKQEAVNQGMADVKALGEQLRASDPLFAAKMPYLGPIVEAIAASGSPPNKWRDAVFKAYSELPEITAPAVEETIKEPTPNPLRPTGTNSAGSSLDAEPGNIDEAIDLALERGY